MPKFDAVAAIKASERGRADLQCGWRQRRYEWVTESVINDPKTKHPVMSAGPGRQLVLDYQADPQDTHLWLPLVHYWPSYSRGAQGIGSCFVAGTPVTMANGELRPIEKVQVGEFVISGSGKPRVVLDTFENPHDGELLKIWVQGRMDPIICTPDHKFVAFPDLGFGRNKGPRKPEDRTPRWLEARELEEGTRLKFAFPRLHHGKGISQAKAWVLGMYLAEGSIRRYPRTQRPNSISFTCGAHEKEIIGKLCQYIHAEFGVEARCVNCPSKPSVTSVRINSVRIAKVFARWFPGDVYSKTIPRIVRTATTEAKKAFIRGWMDGDGHLRVTGQGSLELTGVSVNRNMLRDMQVLAMSCGLKATARPRKARLQSKAAGSLHMYGEVAKEIYPDDMTPTKPRSRDRVTDGIALPVVRIERCYSSQPVYCIEVEEEHTFQANGASVSNCVGWGAEIACTCLCTKAWFKRRRRVGHPQVAECSTEYSYGLSRVEGRGLKKPAGMSDGANGGHAATGHRDWGAVLRLDYSGDTGFREHDLREYDVKKEKDWGNWGAGGDNDTSKVQWDGPLDRVAKEHPVKTITYCGGFDEVAAAIGGARCPVTIASMYACSMKRDKYGYSRKQGSWAHQMCLIAVRQGSHPGALCAQSWGPQSASGPSGDEYSTNLPPTGTPQNILGFTWWMPPEDVDWVCKSGEVIAYGDIDGWKMDRGRWDTIT